MLVVHVVRCVEDTVGKTMGNGFGIDRFFLEGNVDESKLTFPLNGFSMAELGDNRRYELFAVVVCVTSFFFVYPCKNRYGSRNFGHYFTHAKISNEWYEFNDLRILKVHESEVLSGHNIVLLFSEIGS